MNNWKSLDRETKSRIISDAVRAGLSSLSDIKEYYARGGIINIAPSKRGTFTAAATKHGKGVQEFARQVLANKENYSPAMVRKAVFAHNSKSWKHDDGGNIRPSFDEWYKAVPASKSDTTNYDLRRAYNIAPQEQLDAFVNNPEAHLNSAYYNPNTEYIEWMKSKAHPTAWMELMDYELNQNLQDFRNRFRLENDPNHAGYLRYVPRKFGDGGSWWDRFLAWFKGSDTPKGIDYDELRRRQAYAESGFNNTSQSPAGAVGMFQIMPSVLKDYNTANSTSYAVEDLKNQATNSTIRDWYMDNLKKREWVTKGNANDSIQEAKALAAYNYGSTNVVNALNNAKAKGIDIYKGWEWLKQLPQETREYVDFILRGKDNSTHRNNVLYNQAKLSHSKEVKELNKKARGGYLFKPGELLYPIEKSNSKKFDDGGKTNQRKDYSKGAVPGNRSYWQIVKENAKEGWNKFKHNYLTNAFLFPFEDIEKGNTLAVLPLFTPIPYDDVIRSTAKVAEPIVRKWSPSQWTAAQDAAIARGDMTEAQRLRDLHAKINGYKIKGTHASKISDTFTEFNTGLKIKGTNKSPTIYSDVNNITAGAFFGDNSKGAINQFGKTRDFLLRIDRPLRVDAYGRRYNKLLLPGTTKEDLIKNVNYLRSKGYTEEQINSYIQGQLRGNTDEYALKVFFDDNYDGAIIENVYEGHMNPEYMENAIPTTDYIITKPNQARLADAVTYDDKGIRIPLGERDNFNINDIRYLWTLPVIGLGAAGITQKSTGGPLYPFSFSKNINIKTPVVRY